VRLLFTAYVLFIAAVLVLYFVIGLVAR